VVVALFAVACGGEVLEGSASKDAGKRPPPHDGASPPFDSATADAPLFCEIHECQAEEGGATEDVDGNVPEGATEDAFDGEFGEGGEAGPPTCPSGSKLFAPAQNPQTITLDSANAYWTNAPVSGGTPLPTGSVDSRPRGASSAGVKNLVAALTGPLFVTHGSGFVAFSVLGKGPSTGGGTGSVDLYGESGGTLFAPGMGLAGPAGVAMDSEHVYWVARDAGGLIVQSATLTGDAGITLGTVAGDYTAGGLAVNGDNLYFAGWIAPAGSGGAIFTVPIGGGTPKPLQELGTGEPFDVITDTTSVYWSDVSLGGVYSMPLGASGGTVTTLASGLGEPVHLAVDAANVYTGDFMAGRVYEIPISGGAPKTLVTSVSPNGVATDDSSENLLYFTTETAICAVSK